MASFPVTTGDLISAADWNSIGTFQIESIDLSSVQTFTSIPQVYRDLRVELVVRPSSPSTTRPVVSLQFNGSATAYRWQHNRALNTTAAGVVSPLPDVSAVIGPTPGTGSTADVFANYGITISSYQASFLKVGRSDGGMIHVVGATTDWQTTTCNFMWGSTAAITSMVFLLASGTFAAGSRATLYGVGLV